MKVNRENLLKEVQSVTPGLSDREIIEQSSCVIFQDGQIMTFNDEVACVLKTKLNIKGAIQANPFLAMLQKFQEEYVDIFFKKNEVIIKGKRKKAGIRMEQKIQLPLSDIERPKKWKPLPDDFAEGVGLVEQCAGKDESQFDLTCIHLHPKWVEACDNYQVSRYKMELNLKRAILVRRESLKFVTSLDMTKFSETRNWVHFKNPTGLILSCRRYVEEYPDMTKILKVKGKPVTLPKNIKEAIEKAEVFSSENPDDSSIVVHLDVNKLKISGEGSSGWFKESKIIKYKGPPMTFHIAPKLLIKLMQQQNKCKITNHRLCLRVGKLTYVAFLQMGS